MNSICVFCGSQSGRDPRYEASARRLGAALAARGLRLVYGGGRWGMMGSLAQAALDHGGHVVGVIPRFLSTRDVMHDGLSDRRIVSDLFERKSVMIELADAFVALPGGLGTADELLEVITWTQLHELDKPIGVRNVGSYFDPWFAVIDHIIREGFAAPDHVPEIIVESDPATLLAGLSAATGAGERAAR